MVHTKSNELGQFIPLHYHFQMLADDFRMKAFYDAIKFVVKPDYHVVELGSGTGILSYLSAKQGAMVTAVEYNPSLVSASKKYISENGLSNQINIINEDAANWLPKKPADVVICEMLHSALLREKQVQVLSNFKKAHLKEFGRIPIMIPSATLLGVQPVYQNYDFYGYHAPVPLFQSPYHTSCECEHSQEPIVYKIVDYTDTQIELYEANLIFTFEKDTSVNALRFVTKNLLSIDLYTGETVDWFSQHLVLPLYNTIDVKAGKSINVRFIYTPGAPIEKLSSSIIVKTVDYNNKSNISMTA